MTEPLGLVRDVLAWRSYVSARQQVDRMKDPSDVPEWAYNLVVDVQEQLANENRQRTEEES